MVMMEVKPLRGALEHVGKLTELRVLVLSNSQVIGDIGAPLRSLTAMQRLETSPASRSRATLAASST